MADLLIIALEQRCHEDLKEADLNENNLASQFRLHLHRGIGYLSADNQIKGIESLF